MDTKQLIIDTFRDKASRGQIKSKSNLVEIISNESTLAEFRKFDVDLKELLPELLKLYDQYMAKQGVQEATFETENVSRVKTPSKEEFIHIKDGEESALIANYKDKSPEELFREAETEAIIESGRPVTKEEIAHKYKLENHSENLYSIFDRKGQVMSSEEIGNFNVFLAAANEAEFDITEFSVNTDCTKYINDRTGEIYEVRDSKLIKAEKENTVETAEEIETKEEEIVDEKQLLDNLDRINYSDAELIEMLNISSLSDETIEEIISRISAPQDEKGNYILPKDPVKILTRETPKAAFINVLILSLVSFFFSVMTVLIILVKMQG